MPIPAGTKFIGIGADVPTPENKSSQNNSFQEVYTIEDFYSNSNLQSVTDEGNTTTNDINLDGSSIVLDNLSKLTKGWIDNGADGGIARECAVNYQDQWENGIQYFINQGGYIVWANSINGSVPDIDFDITRGYIVGSIFHNMNTQSKYKCTDNTDGAAVWIPFFELYSQTIVSIDSTQILAMGTTPIELLPAPGAGKYYDIEKVILEYKHNTTAYTTTSTQLYITQGNDMAYFPTLLTLVNNDQIVIPRCLQVLDEGVFISVYTPIQNSALKLWNYNGDDPTLGNGNLLAIINYTVRTFGA